MAEPKSTSTKRAPEAIWKDDLLDRRGDAELLVGYIESLLERPSPNRQDHAYSIAVDAGYGEGKSFFLKRLSEHLSLNHPVAYIDAWADDIADEPLVAIAATLKEALAPVIAEPGVEQRWSSFLDKSTKIARIAGLGLLKRGIGFMITQQATEALSEVISGFSDAVEDAANDAIKDTSKEAVDGVAAGLVQATRMGGQIKAFQEARQAIEAMKDSLRAIVDALGDHDLHAPIVIVIDELDRCRPSYAIKLLEQVKHLFDVPGIVFIFGLHGDQLAHSISGAYGPQFDGKSYLRRFINRRYSLGTPNHRQLAEFLLTTHNIKRDNFLYPDQVKWNVQSVSNDLPTIISIYANSFSLSARDLFQITDIFETSVGISRRSCLLLPYFLPLAVGHFLGLGPGQSPPFSASNIISFYVSADRAEKDASTLFGEMKRYAYMSEHDLGRRDDNSYYFSAIIDCTFRSQDDQVKPRNYPRLLSAVSRFSRT